MKRILAFALSLCIAVGAVPELSNYVPDMAINASAEDVSYSFDSSTGTLTISGTGAMQDYVEGGESAPWNIYYGKVKEVVIGSGVTHIGIRAFAGFDTITTVTISDSVTSIGEKAFTYCTNLSTLTLPDTITTIGDSAFSNCEKLTSVTMPKALTSLGEHAFGSCVGLKNITFPDCNASIGAYAFCLCTSLQFVTLGNGSISIGEMAFIFCSSLWLVTVENGLTSIGDYAFSGCSDLGGFVLPRSVTSVGIGAFSGCSSMGYFTVRNPNCYIADSATTISHGYNSEIQRYYFDGTIYCYSGSTAQAYAEKYGYSYKLRSDTTPGDADLNDVVDAIDASLVLTHYSLTSTGKSGVITDENSLGAADYDGNEVIDARDASAILTYYADQSVNKT